MLGCRMLAERAQRMSSQGLFCADVDTATGHEAPEVGALINLGPEDCVASGRRDYLARFIQGAPLHRVFADLLAGRSDEQYGLAPFAGTVDMILPASAVLSQLGLALGAAWAFKLNRNPRVAVSIADDHSTWAATADAVHFSAAHRLPIVHIVVGRATQDGELAVSSHTLPCFVVDGHDVVAVYRVAQEAIRRARQGHGPALIEYRMTSTAAGADRSLATPQASGRFDDPLEKMEAHLRSKSLWSDKWKMKLVERFTRDLDRAIALARTGSGPRTAKKPLPSSSGDTKSGRPAAEDGSTFMKSAVTGDTGRLAGSRS